VADRSVSVPMTLNDLERRARMVKFFWQISVNYAGMVWPGMTKFGIITPVGKNMFLGGQPRPQPKEWFNMRLKTGG